MRAQDIIGRGVQAIKNNDKTFSHNGKPDFEPDQKEIITVSARGGNARPARPPKSINNSYT